jgi:hypothetical protein
LRQHRACRIAGVSETVIRGAELSFVDSSDIEQRPFDDGPSKIQVSLIRLRKTSTGEKRRRGGCIVRCERGEIGLKESDFFEFLGGGFYGVRDRGEVSEGVRKRGGSTAGILPAS